MSDAQTCLREPSPFMLLEMASGILELTTPRPLDDLPGRERERIDGPSLIESFIGAGYPALDALALAVTVVHPDQRLAGRWRRAIGPVPGPDWLTTMDQVTVTGCVLQTHPQGDGDNLLISWAWPDGSAATVVVYIDHNLGTVVKDAFAVPEAGPTLVATYTSLDDGHMTFAPIDGAEARARIEEAIGAGEITVPPLETDTWPLSRPLVEWVVRQLPAGGTGHVRPEWPEADRSRLLDEFLASPHGTVAGLTPARVGQLADPLLWFGCDYGPGDPLRWSPVAVEIVLADWFPRKIFGLPPDQLRHLPEVLASFVRFADQRRAIAPDLTAATLAAVDRWGPDFLAAIERPGRSPRSNAARLARLASGVDPDGFDDDGFDPDGFDPDGFDDGFDDDGFDDGFDLLGPGAPGPGQPGDPLADELVMEAVVDDLEATVMALVGGPAAYAALDDRPLADVAFDHAQVAGHPPELVTATLDHLDRWASELFDDEVRTIARAMLAGVLRVDRSLFKRSPRTDVLAAAVLARVLVQMSSQLTTAEARTELGWRVHSAKTLAEATGLSPSTVSARSAALAAKVEQADLPWPTLLHSSQRAEVLKTRALIASWRDAERA